MNRIKTALALIVSFFASLFGRTINATSTASTPTAAEVRKTEALQVKKDPRTRSRRIHKGVLLASGRVDGGGRHFCSKRAVSNHRRSASGKRTGRS